MTTKILTCDYRPRTCYKSPLWPQVFLLLPNPPPILSIISLLAFLLIKAKAALFCQVILLYLSSKMSSSTLVALAAVAHMIFPILALNLSCAPGGYFDLSKWELQLPTGSAGHPDTEFASQLKGCDGYQDHKRLYFFTESGDGALISRLFRSHSLDTPRYSFIL